MAPFEMCKIKFFITVVVFLAIVPDSFASKTPEAKKLFSETFDPYESIGNIIGDYSFIDEEGNKFSLAEFRGKPYIMSMIYTSCDIICPTITMNIREALDSIDSESMGKFRVLTVGFDSQNDTPEYMKDFAEAFGKKNMDWKFASSDKITIENLSRDLGFSFKKTGEEFEHINMVTIVDAGGRVYRHIFGVEFTPEQLLAPIKESISGKPPALGGEVPFLKGAVLWCLKYDPITGEYSPDWGHISFLIAGVAIHFFLIAFLWHILKSMRRYDSSTAANHRAYP